jgi:hypothetical protein
MPSPTRYRIQIHVAGPHQYRASGAVEIAACRNPMVDSARALLARGSPPDATLAGIFEANAISPVTLHRLARVYVPPRVNHRAADPSRNID